MPARSMHRQGRHRKVTLLNTERPFYIYVVASPCKPCHFKKHKVSFNWFGRVMNKKLKETEVPKYIAPPFTPRSSVYPLIVLFCHQMEGVDYLVVL